MEISNQKKDVKIFFKKIWAWIVHRILGMRFEVHTDNAGVFHRELTSEARLIIQDASLDIPDALNGVALAERLGISRAQLTRLLKALGLVPWWTEARRRAPRRRRVNVAP
jgi:AraC-like DNA-binding protein